MLCDWISRHRHFNTTEIKSDSSIVEVRNCSSTSTNSLIHTKLESFNCWFINTNYQAHRALGSNVAYSVNGFFCGHFSKAPQRPWKRNYRLLNKQQFAVWFSFSFFYCLFFFCFKREKLLSLSVLQNNHFSIISEDIRLYNF